MTSATLSARRVAEASAAALEDFDSEEVSLRRDLEATTDAEALKRIGWQLDAAHANRSRVLRLALLAEAACLEEPEGRAPMTVDAEDFRLIAAWYEWPRQRRIRAVEVVRGYVSRELEGSEPALVASDQD
jgi:hypothetical protein